MLDDIEDRIGNFKVNTTIDADFTSDPNSYADVISKILFRNKKGPHILIFIDEIDNIIRSSSQKKFVEFIQAILKTKTNTSIIGIANSIDLIQNLQNKSKRERDFISSKLVYTPYNQAEIIDIMRSRLNFLDAFIEETDEDLQDYITEVSKNLFP